MAKENACLEFILKKIDETRNLLKERKRNDLMSEKHKKIHRALNYFAHFLLFIPAVSCCV